MAFFSTIDLRPSIVDVIGYAGDTVTLTLSGEGLPPSGVTAWSAQARASSGNAAAIPFAVSVASGTVTLSLSAAATAQLGAGWAGNWDVQHASDDGTVRTFVRGKLTIEGDVTRSTL